MRTSSRYHSGMVKRRVEECLELSLDDLPGFSDMKWRTSRKVSVPWEDDREADGERSHLLMVVIRLMNELTVAVDYVRSSYPLACHDVAIDPQPARRIRGVPAMPPV